MSRGSKSQIDDEHEQDIAIQEVAQQMEEMAPMTDENTVAACKAAVIVQQFNELAGRLRGCGLSQNIKALAPCCWLSRNQ